MTDTTGKINLLGLTQPEMEKFFESIGGETLPCRSGHEVDSPFWRR